MMLAGLSMNVVVSTAFITSNTDVIGTANFLPSTEVIKSSKDSATDCCLTSTQPMPPTHRVEPDRRDGRDRAKSRCLRDRAPPYVDFRLREYPRGEQFFSREHCECRSPR